jgi:hypothetical protein
MRLRTPALAAVLSIVSLLAGRAQQPDPIEMLTVPPDRLPLGCALSPSATANVGNQIVGGLWASLPITSNPWTGTDRRIIATIRERIEGPQPGPSAPLSRSEAARFRLALADGVEEAYAAVYMFQSQVIALYGVRYAATAKGAGFPTKPRLTGVKIGSVVAYIDGNANACSKAIEAHLAVLAQLQKW